jgi:hypothetical protein
MRDTSELPNVRGIRHLPDKRSTRSSAIPNSPEVLVLYRKRADGTSVRSGRVAARRAFDTAT